MMAPLRFRQEHPIPLSVVFARDGEADLTAKGLIHYTKDTMMAKGIVVYYSRSGNTQEMAETIAQAMNDAGLNTQCKAVDKVTADDLPEYDAIVLGSPCYYGQMAGTLKHLIDEMVGRHGQLNGKVLIAGMVVQGDPQGAHYGPLSIGRPDEKVKQQCIRRGQRVAELTKRLFS